MFGTGSYSYSLSTPLKSIQLFDPAMNVDVLGNFGLTTASINPTFPQTGMWYDYFKGDSINVLNINDPIVLQPGEYRLYTSKKLASPGMFLGINDIVAPDKKPVITAYPNPSPAEFTFEIHNMYPTATSVSIFDITGSVIWQTRTGFSADEIQLVKWDGNTTNGYAAPGGIYFVQVRTSVSSETIKIIKE